MSEAADGTFYPNDRDIIYARLFLDNIASSRTLEYHEDKSYSAVSLGSVVLAIGVE